MYWSSHVINIVRSCHLISFWMLFINSYYYKLYCILLSQITWIIFTVKFDSLWHKDVSDIADICSGCLVMLLKPGLCHLSQVPGRFKSNWSDGTKFSTLNLFYIFATFKHRYVLNFVPTILIKIHEMVKCAHCARFNLHCTDIGS
jgi:hypothetical protein